MTDPNQSERKHPRKNNPDPLKPVLIIFVLILLVLFGAGIFFFNGPDETLEKSDSEPLNTSGQVQPGDEQVRDRTTEDGPSANQIQDMSVIAGNEIQPGNVSAPGQVNESPEEAQAKQCRILAEQVHGFFTHVDSEDYIKQFELHEPSLEYFIALTNKLLKNPPVVSRESDDLYTILKNMAHFFRVIGKDNIILIKTILDRERDKIEDVAAELYQWTAWNSCNDELLQFSPSLVEMYEYAGFFLNTMGGRSYLFRRDSRSRLLVNYYSVLLIEHANKEGINRHGIDITQIIPQLVQEIDSSSQLIYKENYIDSLYTLLEKYQ